MPDPVPDRSAATEGYLCSTYVEVGRSEHLPAVIALAKRAGVAPHWPEDAWKKFVQAGCGEEGVSHVLLLARTAQGTMLGGLAASRVFETAELEYVFVDAGHLRQGIGRQLVEHWMGWARAQGAQEAMLEVRPSNAAALRLYATLGFAERGRRAGYYQKSREDALVLWRPL